MPIRGGKILRAHLSETKKKARATNSRAIRVGFLDKRAAALAAIHEYGEPRASLPSRPAFRAAVGDMGKSVRHTLAKASNLPSDRDLARAGEAAAEELRASYLNAPGPELSERQRERKEGTPHSDKLLIGAKGPRLISHIESAVERRRG